MLAHGRYFAKKAVSSIRESPWVSLLATLTIAVSLFVSSLYALTLENLSRFAIGFGRTAAVTVYLKDGLVADDHERLRTVIEENPKVLRATLIMPATALERFRARGPRAAMLVEGVSPDILPVSVELALAPGLSDLTAVAALARELMTIDGVYEIDFGQEDLARLTALLEVLRYGGLAGALLIGLAVIFIVSNTIRLTMYARRDEIGILGLVGATAWFIRVPFLLEGAFWGFGGGLITAGAMYLLELLAAPSVTLLVGEALGGLEVHLFSARLALLALLAGTLLGALASGLSVRRFLDAELR